MNGYGTVYKLTPRGDLTILVQFDGSDGDYPVGPLVQGSDGRLYGIANASTNSGGPCVVFSVTTAGTDFTYYVFQDAYIYSDAGLVQGNDGNFYGTVYTNIAGPGEVFKITPSPNYARTVMCSFNGSFGSNPYPGPLLATHGNFYGVANSGGKDGFGTLYEYDADTQKCTDQWDFTAGTDGAYPSAPLIQNTNGVIYGDAQKGGSNYGYGAFFEYDIHLKPFVSLLPTSGKVGATVEILGQGLTGTTAVSFNGTAAKFTVVSNTYMTAVVPNGATNGFVTVTTPKGTLKSNRQFQVSKKVARREKSGRRQNRRYEDCG